MSKSNYVVYDLETTGTKPELGHEIVELAAIPIAHATLEEHHAGRFYTLLKPQYPDKADPEAIKIIGQDKFDKAMAEGVSPKVGLQKFIDWFSSVHDNPRDWWSKPIRIGHNNIGFDNGFLDHWLIHYGVVVDDPKWGAKGPWHYMKMDNMFMYHMLFEADDRLNKYNLDDIGTVMGRSRSSNTHGAFEDVEITADLFVRALRFIRTARKEVKVSK